MYDFTAEGPEEVSLKAGGTVTVTREMGDWLEGDYNGRHGIFPTAYIQMM